MLFFAANDTTLHVELAFACSHNAYHLLHSARKTSRQKCQISLHGCQANRAMQMDFTKIFRLTDALLFFTLEMHTEAVGTQVAIKKSICCYRKIINYFLSVCPVLVDFLFNVSFGNVICFFPPVLCQNSSKWFKQWWISKHVRKKERKNLAI